MAVEEEEASRLVASTARVEVMVKMVKVPLLTRNGSRGSMHNSNITPDHVRLFRLIRGRHRGLRAIMENTPVSIYTRRKKETYPKLSRVRDLRTLRLKGRLLIRLSRQRLRRRCYRAGRTRFPRTHLRQRADYLSLDVMQPLLLLRPLLIRP